MKVDVVVCFYHQAPYWPLVRWGLHRNSDRIHRIIVVNDEPWGDDDYKVLNHEQNSFPIILQSHIHNGFGLCRSANQGIHQAHTEWVLLIEGDEILLPGSVSRTVQLAQREGLVCGLKRYIAPDTRLDELPNPRILEDDHRLLHNKQPNQRWFYCSGGHLLIHKPSFDRIGGFNEAFDYGLADFDLAVRWMTEFGYDSLVWEPTKAGYVWHIGSGHVRVEPVEKNFQMFYDSLHKMLEGEKGQSYVAS